MKVVVVGTNQKDRKRVARVIRNKYEGLAEENAALLTKLERSNDAWIRGQKEIDYLKAEMKEDFEQATAIIHDEGVKNILLKEQIAMLEVAMKEERVRIVTGQFNQICGYCGEEMTAPSQWEKLQDHIQKCKKHPLFQAREQIAALREVGEKLRDYLTESGGNERYSSVDIPDEIWVPFIEALRGEGVKE